MRAFTPLVVLVVAGCLGAPTGPSQPSDLGPGDRYLFIGNSLTYVNDVPGILQALADSGGVGPIAVATIGAPNFALVDHWQVGTAQREVARGGWKYVVLQQGPSSVEVNRDTLRLAARAFGDVAARTGARIAMFAAWPQEDRRQDFPRAHESYALAAQDVNGVLLPVSAGWIAAWQLDPAFRLYSDGLHATADGSYLAALIMYARLFDRSPVGLPARLRTRRGVTVVITPRSAQLLQEAARQVTQPDG